MQEGEKRPKEGFFKKLIKSIKDFDKYGDFAIEKTSAAFGYLVKLMLIFSVVVGIVFTFETMKMVREGIQYTKDSFPEFNFKNNELSVESDEPLIYQDEKKPIACTIIDTKIEPSSIEEYTKKAGLYTNSIIVLKDRIVLQNDLVNGQTVFMYSDIAPKYNPGEFNKETLIKKIDDSMTQITLSTFFIMILYIFIIYTLRVLLDVLLLAILAYFVARIARMKIIFKANINMAIHALTLSIILAMFYISFNSLTGFVMESFQWVYTTISYVYIIVAILMIKTDIIATQIELTKIAEVQKQVRREMDETEQEEKESLDKNPDEEQHEGKEEKNEKEDKEKLDGSKA